MLFEGTALPHKIDFAVVGFWCLGQSGVYPLFVHVEPFKRLRCLSIDLVTCKTEAVQRSVQMWLHAYLVLFSTTVLSQMVSLNTSFERNL